MNIHATALRVETPCGSLHTHIMVWDKRPTTAQVAVTALKHFHARPTMKHCSLLAKMLTMPNEPFLLQELVKNLVRIK